MIFLKDYYWLISLFIALLCLIFLFIHFEKGKTRTGRMVIIAIMIALSVAGRFIPFLKPVGAFAIITGVCLGGEAGFMVGALTALISNIWFGQGPWTPFQMFAWGTAGLFAGILSRRLIKSIWLVLLYGAAAGIVYSFIMDIWTVLWASPASFLEMYGKALLTAVPYTISYALSNVLFLYIMYKPLSRRLERIKIKYGI